MRFQFDIYGERTIDRELVRVGRFAGNASPAFRAIIDDMIDVERKQFGSQGGYRSGGWSALAPSTIESKRRDSNATVRKNATRILHATERLLKSFTSKGHPDMIYVVDDTYMAYGSSVPYGKYHAKKRPPLAFNENDKRRFLKTLQRYVLTGEV